MKALITFIFVIILIVAGIYGFMRFQTQREEEMRKREQIALEKQKLEAEKKQEETKKTSTYTSPIPGTMKGLPSKTKKTTSDAPNKATGALRNYKPVQKITNIYNDYNKKLEDAEE